TLVLEVSLSRLLSVVTWYHLAFFAVSTAMLGMTAGATFVYLKKRTFSDADFGRFSIAFASSIPAALVLLCLVPIQLTPTATSLLALLVATSACALPFFYSGIVISAVMTQTTLPIHRLYAVDLIGASLGCVFVLGALHFLDATSLILLCSGLALLAALFFGWNRWTSLAKTATAAAVLGVGVLASLNAVTPAGLRPAVVKGSLERIQDYLFERWNSHSRVVVYREVMDVPQLWGASPRAPLDARLPQYNMNIDGAAGTVLRRYQSAEDLDHLRYDVVNVAYYLRPAGGAVVIGLGGGRDVQSALIFGHDRVLGIDVNPIFIDLLEGPFREFAGIADRPEVRMVADEARSYLSRTDERFAVMQMSLIDTWASTGAGAFSLSENALYTVEAWRLFLDRLTDDGLFTVSRWYSPEHMGETGRLLSLAVASLLSLGVADPAAHLAMVTSGYVSTLIVSRSPLAAKDLQTLTDVSDRLEYAVPLLPGRMPSDPALARILSARSLDELHRSVADEPYNLSPPTDESPYFFNMLKLRYADRVLRAREGVLRGNLVATLTLLALIASLFVLTSATVLLPLVRAARSSTAVPPPAWDAAFYFSLIGCGFMLAEIALIQRLSVFLGHPVYALGIILFTIIASSGVGSFLSERLPIGRRSVLFGLPAATAGLLILLPTVLTLIVNGFITAPIATRILLSIAVTFPVGLFLGQMLPTGMRIVRQNRDDTPWYWALNGVCGVLCSALAVMISIYWGISLNFTLAAICYLLCAPLLHHMGSQATFAFAPSRAHGDEAVRSR
ncbi:MAG: hypothetical protein ACREQJ_19040, partial [Candidatus Binatia bacterium]